MAGLRVRELGSNAEGHVDLEQLRQVCRGELRHQIAGMMITVPSTLGIFDPEIRHIIDIVHQAGGLMYLDGANMNALMGVVKPAALGFDCMHFNLHKTFSTPHGGGGPGSGAVGCIAALAPYLPAPLVDIVDEGDPPLYGFVTPAKTIGRLKAFHGNFGMHLRAYAYIRVYGASGIRDVTRHAVLNANYLRARLAGTYAAPFPGVCGHEFVVHGRFDDAPDIHALDIAKRLIDYGFHPPTNYFPLNVAEALLIEPAETEALEELDAFADAMLRIAAEARANPQLLQDAPHTAPVRRLDETYAARSLMLCCPAALPVPA